MNIIFALVFSFSVKFIICVQLNVTICVSVNSKLHTGHTNPAPLRKSLNSSRLGRAHVPCRVAGLRSLLPPSGRCFRPCGRPPWIWKQLRRALRAWPAPLLPNPLRAADRLRIPLSVSVLQIRPRDGSVALRDGFVAHGTAPLRTLAPFRSTGRPESL